MAFDICKVAAKVISRKAKVATSGPCGCEGIFFPFSSFFPASSTSTCPVFFMPSISLRSSSRVDARALVPMSAIMRSPGTWPTQAQMSGAPAPSFCQKDRQSSLRIAKCDAVDLGKQLRDDGIDWLARHHRLHQFRELRLCRAQGHRRLAATSPKHWTSIGQNNERPMRLIWLRGKAWVWVDVQVDWVFRSFLKPQSLFQSGLQIQPHLLGCLLYGMSGLENTRAHSWNSKHQVWSCTSD